MKTFMELSNLDGRCTLITGAAGGLGQMMSNVLAELGSDLILVDKLGSGFQEQKEYLSQRWGVKIEYWICDLESEQDRAELILALKENGRNINILINNAAFVGSTELLGWAKPFEMQSIQTWRRAIEVNLTAVFDMCQGLLPLLTEAEGASIINIASIYGCYGPDWEMYEGTEMGNPAAYGVTKGGLIQFTRWLATTLAPKVRVNAISPGGIIRSQSTEFIERYAAKTPLKRMATEEDFCGAIAFLATDLSRYVTGQNLMIDGGWGVW